MYKLPIFNSSPEVTGITPMIRTPHSTRHGDLRGHGVYLTFIAIRGLWWTIEIWGSLSDKAIFYGERMRSWWDLRRKMIPTGHSQPSKRPLWSMRPFDVHLIGWNLQPWEPAAVRCAGEGWRSHGKTCITIQPFLLVGPKKTIQFSLKLILVTSAIIHG